jgi:hypothetical protein
MWLNCNCSHHHNLYKHVHQQSPSSPLREDDSAKDGTPTWQYYLPPSSSRHVNSNACDQLREE